MCAFGRPFGFSMASFLLRLDWFWPKNCNSIASCALPKSGKATERSSERSERVSECLVTLWVSGWPHMNVFLFIFPF